MKKGTILVSILSMVMVLAVVSACAAPVATPPETVPSNRPGGDVITVPPEQGVPSVAPGIPNQGAATGASPAVAQAPDARMATPGGFVNTSPSFAMNSQFQNTGILVTGQGQVTAAPDTAYLTLGVNSQAATVAAAQTNAANAMSAVMLALKNKGIAESDITTVGYNINQAWDYKTNTTTGYQVSNTITVKIRKIGDTGAIIDAVAAAGGNLIRVNSLSFTINDPTPFMKQARQLAMADAKDKAGQLATLGGVTLGLPAFITESSGYYAPSPMYYGAEVAARDAATPINPGETQISVNVQVIYSIQ